MKNTKEFEWLNDTNSQSLQQTLMHLDAAFQRFFDKVAGYPKFKKRKDAQSFAVPQHFKINGNRLFIPKLKSGIRMFVHRKVEGTPRSLTISMTPTGKFFVSILAEIEQEQIQPMPIKESASVGIDVCVNAFATLSDGMRIENLQFLKKSEKKLKREQRRLSRKKIGSNNREKQRIKLAKVNERIANQRDDFFNRVSDAILKAYTVAIEDLNVKGLMKNHKLARSISDVGIGTFFAMLKAKALQRGKNIIVIGQFDPSTKMCSNCGNIKDDLDLSDRIYHCDVCCLTIDRDLNAAINIKRFVLIRSGVPTDSMGNLRLWTEAPLPLLSLFKRERIVASALVEAGSLRLKE